MKKYLSHLLLVPMVFLAITPPMDLALDCTINSTFWLWMTFASGFLAFLFLYQKVSTWLKLFVLWCFVSCFISKAPYMSFTMFWSVIACSYYYALCTRIVDFTPVKKTIQAIFFFITLLVIMQILGKDALLNFGQTTPRIVGLIGNRMIASSFMCVLAPFLLFNPLNWIVLGILSIISGSSGAMLSIGAGLTVYAWAKLKKLRIGIIIIAILIPIFFAWKTGDIKTFTGLAGRRPVYLKTVELSLKQPLGYGIGTYKILFPHLCGIAIRDEQAVRTEWNVCHNDWLQILFETGFVGVILLLGWLVSIVVRTRNPIKLAGLAIIGTNMIIHFPTRMVQSAFLILIFLAYCSKNKQDDGSSYNIEYTKENIWPQEH